MRTVTSGLVTLEIRHLKCHPLILIFSERELMFMFAICRRRSVYRLSVVCTVRAPYSGLIEIFGNVL